MDEPSSENQPQSRADRLACILFLILLAGLFLADLFSNYAPVKLSALFIILFWFALLPLHEAGHAVVCALLGWRVMGVVIGIGPLLARFMVAGVPVHLRIIPVEGYVIPVPRHLRQVRLRSALIYFAGPGAELLVLAFLVALLGLDRLVSPTDDIAVIAAQSLVIAILASVVLNLVPHPVPKPPEGRGPDLIANDGLGILRSFSMPDSYFAEQLALSRLDLLLESLANEPKAEDESEPFPR